MVDVFPTLAKLTGGKVPESCDGRSLEPVLKKSEGKFRDFALSRYPRGSTIGYSMRNERWRYTEWIKASSKKIVYRELFDHAETQLAPRNLASDPEKAELIAKLSKQLDSAGRVQTSQIKTKK